MESIKPFENGGMESPVKQPCKELSFEELLAVHREEQASRESKAGEGKCRAESWDTSRDARIVAKRVKSFKKKSVFPNTLSLEQSRRGGGGR